MEKVEHERGQFASSIGFIMAAAGSAIGLGNLWVSIFGWQTWRRSICNCLFANCSICRIYYYVR